MSALDSIFQQAGDSLGDFLPRLGGALALLVVGLLLARLLVRLLVRLFLAAGLDRLAARAGVHDVIARAGLERSLTRLIGFALRLTLSIVVVFAALSLLGLQFLSEALNEGILFLPRLLAALAFVLIGLVLGDFAKQRVDRLAYQMDLRGPLGQVVRVAVLTVFGVLALAQLGVPTGILTSLVSIALAGAVAAFAIAFGLGGRALAEQISAGRWVNSVYKPGDQVAVDGLSGEIVRVETAATVIEADDGRTVRVPNQVLLGSTVTISVERPGDRSD